MVDKEAIQQRYVDPREPGSLRGISRFARTQGLSIKDVRHILERNLAYTLHRPVRRRFPTLKVQVQGVDQQWVADLVDMQKLSRYNGGNKYLLTIVDAFSKYAWVEPVHSKEDPKMRKAFSEVFKRSAPRLPQRLQTDKGTEFYNATVRNLLKDKGIHHFSTSGDAKAGLVERFNRTLKSRMYRYFTAANTLRYIDILQKLVEGYNVSYHRSIKRAPETVNSENEKEVWKILYGQTPRQAKTTLSKVGDHVRLSQLRQPFKKSYLQGWTEEVFEISRVIQSNPITYKVRELDETPVEGTFYKEDLQKVHIDDQTVWRVEKVLRRRGDRLYVQWKGWPSKYNSWIRRQDLA